jgi:hypothetical protein
MSMFGDNGGVNFGGPHPEGKMYDPDGFRAVRQSQIIGTVVLVLIGLLGIASFPRGPEASPAGFTACIILGIAFSVGYGFFHNSLKEGHEYAVSVAKAQSATDLATQLRNANASLEQTNKIMREQKEAIERIKAARGVGDLIIQGNLGPVTIRDTIINSYNTISTTNPELASAIKTLGGYIEESHSKEAAEFFNEFHKHAASGDRNKTLMKSLWRSIVTVLPGVLDLTDVVEKVKELFD